MEKATLQAGDFCALIEELWTVALEQCEAAHIGGIIALQT